MKPRVRGGAHWGASLGAGVGIAVLALVLSSLLAGACVIPDRTFEESRPDCERYCSLVESKCSDERAVYADTAQCLEVCKALPAGNSDDIDVNTIGCRLQLLTAPGFEPPALCPAVGPLGNGRCGDNCDAFCKLRRAGCREEDPENFEFTRDGYCIESCRELTDLATYGVASFDNADTLQCRVRHVALALGSPEQAATECQSSRIVPQVPQTFPCLDSPSLDIADDIDIYCNLVQYSCQGEEAVYDDVDQCKVAARTFRVGEPTDTEDNTLRCRRYHAYAAFEAPQTHCTHAGPTGDGHCAAAPEAPEGNCTSYCKILQRACPIDYDSEFNPTSDDDVASCVQSCTALSDARKDGFVADPRYTTSQPASPQSGPLKCRTLHAVRGLSSPNGAECAAALGDPGSECDPALIPIPL